MTASRDSDRLIHHFLLEGEERLQDQVYDAVCAKIEQRRQRVVIGPWRLPEMNRIVTIGLGAAAVVVAVFVGAQLFGSPSGGLGVDAPSIQSQDEVVFEVALHYYTTTGGGVARVPEPTRIHAQLPDGWVSTETGITNEPEGPDAPIAVSFWTVDAVFTDPCDPDDSDRADPPMMQTLDFLAGAFTAWWSREARENVWQPIPTRVVDSTVSGFRARYLEIRIPATVDMDRCGGRYVTWRNADNAERRHAPGDVSRLWIVEVGPDQGLSPNQGPTTSSAPLLVIDASSAGEVSPEAQRELEDLIESIFIEAPEGLP